MIVYMGIFQVIVCGGGKTGGYIIGAVRGAGTKAGAWKATVKPA